MLFRHVSGVRQTCPRRAKRNRNPQLHRMRGRVANRPAIPETRLGEPRTVADIDRVAASDLGEGFADGEHLKQTSPAPGSSRARSRCRDHVEAHPGSSFEAQANRAFGVGNQSASAHLLRAVKLRHSGCNSQRTSVGLRWAYPPLISCRCALIIY